MDDRTLQEERDAVAAAQRDPREFVRLYDAYADRVYRYLLARVRHVELAEDLTQETFVKALAALPRYRWQGVPFGAWLFRIARNAMIAGGRRAEGVSIDEVAEPSIDARIEDRTDAALVWERARTLLTDDQREALALRFKGGLAIAEVAAAMRKSDAAVKMLLQRGIRTLAARFSPVIASDAKQSHPSDEIAALPDGRSR